MVLACNTNHLQQVNIGRGCTQETVYNRVSGQHLVNQQGVHGRDITMDRVIIHTIAIGIVTITAGTAHLVVEHPGRTVVGLDGRLHIQHTAKHITQVTVKALNILIGIRHSEVVLIGVRIHETGTELNELNVHGIVHTGRITLKIRTGTLKGSLLVIIVKTDIIGIVHTATTEIHTVVLTDTRLKGFTEPVGIGIVLEMIESVRTLAIAARNRDTGILGCDAEILTILCSVCQVVDILLNLVYTKVAFVVNLQGLLFLTALGRDDHHTVSST